MCLYEPVNFTQRRSCHICYSAPLFFPLKFFFNINSFKATLFSSYIAEFSLEGCNSFHECCSIFLFLFCCFFFFLMAASEVYGSSWAKGRIRAAAASLHTPQPRQHGIQTASVTYTSVAMTDP